MAQVNIDDKNYKIELGAQYDIGNGSTHSQYKVEPDGNGGFYSVGINMKTNSAILIDRFDARLNLTKTEEVPLPFVIEKDGAALQSVGNKKYIFYTISDKKTNQATLYSQLVDVSNGKLENEPKKLFTSVKPTSYNSFKYSFQLSSDKSTLLIYYYVISKNEDPKIGLFHYDDNMVQKVGKEITGKDASLIYKNIIVENNGDLAFLYKSYGETTEVSDVKTKFGYLKAGDSKIQPVILPIKSVNDYVLKKLNGEYVIACTYYKESPGIDNADGLFLAKIDVTGKLNGIGDGAFEIPTSVIRQYDSPKEWIEFDKKTDNDVQVPNFKIRELACDASGNFIIVGDINGGGPIFVTSISKSGNVNWWVKVPQNIAQDTYVAHGKFFMLNGNCYIFYMDTPKNIGLTIEQLPNVQALYTDGILVCAKIDANGKVAKSVVYEMDIHEMLFLDPDYGDVSTNQIFNHNKRGKYSRIAKITIKD